MILLIRTSSSQDIAIDVTGIEERRTNARTIMKMFKGDEYLGDLDLNSVTVEILPNAPRVG